MLNATPQNLNARIVLAQRDKTEMDSVIAEYTPFLRAQVKKIILRPKRYGEDDLFAAAQEAFWEAIRTFDETKGNFILFARLVVRRKLLTYKAEADRKNGRDTVFSDLSARDGDGGEIPFDAADETSAPTDNPLKYEIEAITEEAEAFGINLMRLNEYAPKADKTKSACFDAVNYLAARSALVAEMRTTCELPIKKITEATGIARKTIERHRQWIIVVTIVAAGGYGYMSEWIGVKPVGGAA
jgi:RNA polymerase sigma factor